MSNRSEMVDVITEVAREHGVPPELALACAWQESGLDPRAVGDSGTSFGLFQLHRGGHLGNHSREWAFDPQNNAERAMVDIARVYKEHPDWSYGRIAAAAQRPADPTQYAQRVNELVSSAPWAGLGAEVSDPDAAAPQGGAPAESNAFVAAALTQDGDEYVWGAKGHGDDPDPEGFDCSGLTSWAAARVGVEIPPSATAQYLWGKEKGYVVSVREGIDTPGALLFGFDREPRAGDGRTPGAHVAISQGDGTTIEARSTREGVDEFKATTERFDYALIVPGLAGATGGGLPETLPTSGGSSTDATPGYDQIDAGSDPRADEVGSCRLDALTVAARVSRRYQADERLKRLCPVVVPVAGLLAAASTTLREQEFLCLSALASSSPAMLEDLLLTADRFSAVQPGIPAEGSERALLLSRLGLYGVRVGVELLRTGAATTATELARRFASLSGFDELRRLLLVQFVNRSKVLKAHSALTTLRRLLQTQEFREKRRLTASAEEVMSGAHEFAELRLVHLVRSGRVPLDTTQEREMLRLLGGDGTDPASRLGLAEDAGPSALRSAGHQALVRWQRLAEHPLSPRASREAARATARTCEGILADVGAGN